MKEELSIVSVYKNELKPIIQTGLSLLNLQCQWIVVSGANNDEKDLRNIIRRNFTYLPGPDHGIYDGMNRGLNAATGNWVWFLNGGDLCINSAKIMAELRKSSEKIQIFRQINLETMKSSPRVLHKFSLANGIRPIPHQAVIFPKIYFSNYSYRLNFGLISDQEYIWRGINKFGYQSVNLSICLFEGFGSGSAGSSPEKFRNEAIAFTRKKCYFLNQIIRILRFFKNMNSSAN
jgi:hypothetical protein